MTTSTMTELRQIRRTVERQTAAVVRRQEAETAAQERANARALAELQRALSKAARELPAALGEVIDRFARRLPADHAPAEESAVAKYGDSSPVEYTRKTVFKSMAAAQASRDYGPPLTGVNDPRVPLAKRLLDANVFPVLTRSHGGMGGGFLFQSAKDVKDLIENHGDYPPLPEQWLGVDSILEAVGPAARKALARMARENPFDAARSRTGAGRGADSRPVFEAPCCSSQQGTRVRRFGEQPCSPAGGLKEKAMAKKKPDLSFNFGALAKPKKGKKAKGKAGRRKPAGGGS